MSIKKTIFSSIICHVFSTHTCKENASTRPFGNCSNSYEFLNCAMCYAGGPHLEASHCGTPIESSCKN